MNKYLFNNPMIENARKALSPEQQEEYKRIGEYMYNSQEYKDILPSENIKQASDKEIIFYASEALKSGCDPKDLTPKELELLEKVYGSKWYLQFHLSVEDLPKLNSNPNLNLNPKQIKNIKTLKNKKKR